MNDVEKVIDLCTYVAYDLSIIRRTEIGIETNDIELIISILKQTFNLDVSYKKDKENKNIFICYLE